MIDPSAMVARVFGAAKRVGAVHFQLADRCNHACVHCYQDQGELGELDPESALAVIDEFARAGVLVLNLSGGEVTLRTDLLEVIAHARARGMAVSLYTNAYRVDEELATALARLGVFAVYVSLYASRAGIHDAITRVPGSFDRTVLGIRALRAHGLTVILKMVQMASNGDERPGLAALAAELGCTLTLGERLDPRDDGSLLPATLGRTEPRQYPSEPARFTPEAQTAARAGRTCSVGRGGLVVRSTGVAQPCSAFNLPLGDVREGLEGVVKHPLFELLGEIEARHLHGCRDCDLLAACERCHGGALAETGDPFGPQPTACAAAVRRYVAAFPVANGAELPDVGPFQLADGTLTQKAHIRSPDDEALASRFVRATPGRLVPTESLRRRVG